MEEPKPGEHYRHFKGGEYEVIAVARNVNNPEIKDVVYKSLYDGEYLCGTIWDARSLEEFVGFATQGETKVKRFTLLPN